MWYFVREERLRLAGAVGFLFISSGVTLSVPLIMGKLIDFIVKENISGDKFDIINRYIPLMKTKEKKNDLNIEETDRIYKYGCFAITFFVIGGFANFCRFYLIQTAGQNIILNIRNQLYSTLMRKPVTFFDKNKSGDLLSRITADATVVGEGLSNNISNGLRSTLSTVLGTSMMIYVSPELTCMSMVILPPIVIATLIFGRYIKNVSNNVQKFLAQSTEKADETISAIRTVKVFGKENKEINDYKVTTFNVLQKAYQDALLRGSFFGLMGMSGNILIVSLLFYGGSLITAEQLTVGGLSSFLLYAAYASINVSGIGTFYTELMKASGAGSRIWQLLEESPKEDRILGEHSLDDIGDILFENVNFSYPNRPESKILNNFTLCLPKGKTTALIGASGCGKSTIGALLLKFYNIDSGKLTINGKSLADIDIMEWNKHVSAVLQDHSMFSCSIAENIAYGAKLDVSEKDIEVIAEKAQVMEFVRDLPEGLNTKIGENGVLLSGGQRQRIAIARALIANPSLIILDEATSALDHRNERLVQLAMNELLHGRTVLTISHRLALLRSADQIAVIKAGKVVQLGSFDNLEKEAYKFIDVDSFENSFGNDKI